VKTIRLLSYDSRSDYRTFSDYTFVYDLSDAYQREDKHFLEYTVEANLTGQLLVKHRAHHSGKIIHNDKGEQRVQKTIPASEKISQPPSNSNERHLNPVSNILHNNLSSLCIESHGPILFSP